MKLLKKDLELYKTGSKSLELYYCELLSSAFSSFQILNQKEIVSRIRKIKKRLSVTKLLFILHNWRAI